MLQVTYCKNIVKEEDQDEDAWNVSTAAGTCLGLIANTVLDDVVSVVMPFVQKHINDGNWRLREAAILAFGMSNTTPSGKNVTLMHYSCNLGSILEGPTGYIITELVAQVSFSGKKKKKT